MALEARYTGGPRPPVDRRSNARDDLDDFNSSPVSNLAERLVTVALSDLDTEHKWQHASQLQYPCHESFSRRSPSIDSRVPFFGPREPRRRSRFSPITPHTPHTPRTPYTPFTPDTPELETPDDDDPGPRPQPQKQKLDYHDSIPAWEHRITPFPLWKYPIETTPSNDHHHIAELSNSRVHEEKITVPSHVFQPAESWQDGGRSSSDSTDPDEILSRSPSFDSTHAIPRSGSLRPRLSIITQMSYSRDSTTYKGISAPVPSVSSSSNNLHTCAKPMYIPLIHQLPYRLSQINSSPIQDLAQRLTTDILLDKCKYRILLRYRGDEAQQILDCLQVLLDSPTLSGADRAVILKALTRLSVYSGEYPRRFKLRDVETIGNDAVDEGRYGNVWKALVHNQEVCLKVLRTYQRMPTKPLLKMLSHEALLWGQLSHPNILPFYGIYINEVRRNRFGLVSPWMENGNVVNYLKHNPNVSRIPLIHDIASGLQYLHSLNVVHGDIKGNNVLVTPNGRACLADFGLSTLLGDNILDWSSLGSEADHGGGTTRWKAPELVFQEAENMDSKPTFASDVYSLACAAYEILTGQIPFFEIKGSEAVILRLFRSREQPSRPTPEKSSKELTDDVWILLECCWTHEPEERPSVKEILERLEGLMTPVQIRNMRYGGDGACEQDSVLSSSAFRQSFKKGDYELSSEEVVKVTTMISV